MKRIYLAGDSVEANLLKTYLEDDGIEAVVQEEHASAMYGDIPLSLPSVWVKDEESQRALNLVQQFEATAKKPAPAAVWVCPKCGGEVESELEECWYCAAKKPADSGSWTCPKCGEEIANEFSACWKCAEAAKSEAQATAVDASSPKRALPVHRMIFVLALILVLLFFLFYFQRATRMRLP